MFDKDKQNIYDIFDSIKKIIEYLNYVKDYSDFEKNSLIIDAVLMNIVVIGEASNRLTESFKENNQQIEWSKIRGLRNIIAHDYFGLDLEEIWHICTKIIPEFKLQIEKILASFNK